MNKICIPKLSAYNYIFPDPSQAEDKGLVAWGGDLNPNRLIAAYKEGIFPWFNEGDEILWWSPNPRAILSPKDVKISKSLKKSMKKYRVSFDANFEKVICLCRDVRIENGFDTWILDEVIEAYKALHEKDFAHSVEVWYEDELVGGLYGLSLGKIFCGESMFSIKRDASKVAFVVLAKTLQKYDFIIDCQIPNPHLISLGAGEMPREKFLKLLHKKINEPSGFTSWDALDVEILGC